MHRQHTTIKLLDFSGVFEDIMMHRFHYILPLAVKRLKVKQPSDDEKEDEGRAPKKSKQATLVKNTNVPQEWNRGESGILYLGKKPYKGLN